MESPHQTQPYIDMLDEMLRQLHHELDQQVQPLRNTDFQSLDQYLLDLNTFYYQSFHQRFMPQYRQALENDWRRIHKLSRQEQSLQTDLLNLLRFNVRICNQTRRAVRQLQDLRTEINHRWSTLQAVAETRTVDLLYLLKEHVESWVLFVQQVDIARSLQADKQLLDTLERFPACILAASLFKSADFQAGKEKRDLNRLLSQWQLAIKLLTNIQDIHSTSPGKDLFNSLMNELEKVDAIWDNRKTLPIVRTWYKQSVQPGYQLYLEALRSYHGRSDQRRAARLSAQFQDWLQAWLQILEQCSNFQSRGWEDWLESMPALGRLDEKYALELADFGQRGRRSLDDLISSLTVSQAGSYDSFSQSSRRVLGDAAQFLQKSLDSEPGSRSPLRSTVQKLGAEVDITLRGIELLDEREINARKSMTAYLEIQKVLDAETEILESFSRQMEQMLDSRNLQSRFEDISPQIERVVINTGALLPSAGSGWIEKGLISTEVTEAPEGMILYSEGDIYIIRLGDLVYEEIPKIVVARKG